MRLERRLLQLELNIKSNSKQPGCNISLFIVVPQEQQRAHFESDPCKPGEEELENFLKYLKGSGQCQDCLGSCALDWEPSGFNNHSLTGICSSASSTSTPKIFTMYCADAEIPVLTRRIMNGERTGLEK
jgi:hypothetical protein